MEVLMALVIGFLFSGGTYLLLQRRLIQVIFGTSLISHGSLLLVLTLGRLKTGRPPVLIEGYSGPYVDPLPQALNLTAIVIGFATTAFILVLASKVYQEYETDDLEELRGVDGDE
ncbi:MAG: Na(+)/H(+) antiporter subunit C [Firmicutes bacterium]|nr:Na(+)/H(+) antiporter subunit C [Bacillota bacterium]